MSETNEQQARIRTNNPCHRRAISNDSTQAIIVHYHVFLPCSASATGRTLINVSSSFTVLLVHSALATAQQSIIPKVIKRSRTRGESKD